MAYAQAVLSRDIGVEDKSDRGRVAHLSGVIVSVFKF
jgi:hypothetical protein